MEQIFGRDKVSGAKTRIRKTETIPYSQERSNIILEYVNSLPASELRQKAHLEWDSGVTSRTVTASYEYVDALQGILVTLASFYPDGAFGGDDPKFFSGTLDGRHVAAELAWTWKSKCTTSVFFQMSRMVEDMADH